MGEFERKKNTIKTLNKQTENKHRTNKQTNKHTQKHKLTDCLLIL